MVLIFLIVAMSPEFIVLNSYDEFLIIVFLGLVTCISRMSSQLVIQARVEDELVHIDVGPTVSNLDEQAGLTFLI